MKKKTFILTLMMMFCSFVFGQNQWHWQEPSQGEYQSSMTLIAIVQIDNENQSRADLEMAAFHNGVVRGVTKTQVVNNNGVPASIVVLTIRGDHDYDDIMFKLYVPPTDGNDVGKELVTDLVIPFRANSFIGNITPEVINFYEVHWSSDIVYEQTMTVGCVINIDGEPYEGNDVEVAAFCNEEVRGVGRPVYWEETGQYYTELIVGGKSKGETISFKLYHPEYGELDTDYTVLFENGATIVDENNQAVPMNFIYNSYVAQIGTAKFQTLEAAVEAVKAGETVTILKDINLSETLTIAAEKNFTIDLNGNDITADLDIYGNLIVIGDGNLNADVNLAKETATLTAVQGLNVTTNVNAYSVVYEGGMYKLVAKVYVAQVGTTKYETIQAAVNAATAGQTVTIIANVSSEAVEVNKNITITDNGEFTLNNVSINAVEGTSALTVSNLSFTGNSWINSGAASELVVSGVTADVTPSNASYTNSRSAFISLGRSEQKELELTVENSSIIARDGSDAILGWAAITEANISGNTFGSASAYQTNSDCVKFMAIANNAVLNITNNNVYSNYNGIVFGQNTTRNNAYTANVSGNNFYGEADHIWIEVSGSNTCHATINATSTNKVNGNAFTANDIKTHPNITTWTSYGGVDVVFDSNKKIIGGTFKYIADNVIAEGYEKSANTDGTYGIVKSISGEIAYRAYITDSETREAVQVDLTNIIAKQSVVVKLYDANGNVLTTTSLKAGAVEAANLTCNIVLQGTASGSWETTINATLLTVENIPAKIELWIDGTLKDTFENALGAGTNVDETAKYIALDCVYKEARIGDTYYATINKAIAAAQTGETIVLLADITLANAIDITGKTLDLNGKTVKADIIGTVETNGGLWITSTGHKMLGLGADIYSTENATVVNNANEVNIVSGAITLATTEWWTLQNQNLTIGSGATFTIPATSKFNVMNGTTVMVNGTAINNGSLAIYGTAIVNGTLTVNGTVELAALEATLKAQEGLNVVTNIADYKVVYADDKYQVVAKVYVAQVGSTKYEILSEAVNAAQAGETVTVLKDITLADTLTIAAEKNFTLDLNGKTINAGFQQNSTDKHIYAFDNKGTLTLANGTINARGIYNYGTLTVNANATINSIDANGGYGVGNYGTLNVYGTIATTTEDNDAPTTGNYDASPIVNNAGATINVYEGSKITNVSNYTYALDNKGTAIIKGGSFSSGHTTVGNSGTMTIEGGSFVCNGSEGVTSHAFIAEAGTTTIKGGTFNGKDNYNGFNVCASEGATVIIEGGNFLSCHSGSLYGNGAIEVSGGKFFDAVPENRCAAGYIPTQFTDGYYGVKAGSYIAQIGTTKYETLQAAAAAAQTGQTITVLANVETTNVTLPENVTLDLNGKTVKADIIGKILINNGLWVTAQNYKMIGKNADYYATTDAAIVMGTNYSIEMLSGTVTLVPNVWYTLEGQNITIKQGATFNIGDGQTFVINGSNIVNEGTVNNAGTIQILAGTVKGNVTGNLQFNGGSYITAEDFNMVGKVGDSDYYYNTNNATINIAANGDITIASGDMTLGKSWRTLPGQTVTVAEGATFTVPSGMTYQIYGTAIVNSTLTVNGTVELAALEATLKAQEGLTIESGVEGNKVVYENGMYKLTPMNAYFKGGAYARYVANKDREHFSITLGDVYAKQSLVVKVYSGETLLLTTTYRAEDLDNPGVNRYPVISDKLTVNNVVSGKVSGSWLNEYAQGVELTIANVPDKFEVYADGVLKDTYVGTSELKGFGSEEDLNTYLGFEGVYKAASITNAAGTEYYMTLAEALADVKKDDVLNLHDNATIANPINVTSNLTINGNGKTLTYTGSNRAIEVTAGDFTAENLTIVANGERGINYNVANGQLTLNNVKVEGTSTYALNLPGLSDYAKVTINNSSLTGKIALNVWGENTTITTTNSHFISVDNNAAENYAAIVFNNDGTTSCAGTTIVMDGGSIIAEDENGNPSTAVSNSAVVNFVEGENYSVNNATTIVGEIKTPVAIVTYEGQNAFYSCYTFQDAIDEAIETKGSVKLLTNVASSEIITINGEVKIDGNNKTLTSTATRAINVDYKGKVTICNLTIATTNKTERAINVIQKAAELTLNNVTAEGFKYTIFVAGSSVGSTITTNGGKFSGYAAVNITGSGTTFNSNGTELIGINNAQLHESNNYAVIAVNTVPTENVNVNINGGKVIAQTNVNRQFIATVRYAENANITIDAELVLANGDVLNATIEDIENNGLIVKVRDDYADELYAQGYATSAADANGLVTVLGKSIYEQRQILGAGWNWFSSYININGETGFEKLQTALGTSGLHIKNQHQFVDYNQGWGWNGTLESTSVEEMYMIQTSAEVELVLKGDIVNPAETEITLNNGWTYIGYPVATAMNIEDALENITPNNGDIIKTHGGVAQYYAETKTWYSQSLTSMTPGFGYMYKNNGGEQTLVYPAANTRAEVRANVTAENNRWVPNASAFANNMNIIAVLESNDMMGEFEVAAFVNGEVRGSARPTYVEPIDAYVLFMTIYGEEGDELTFKYYDIYSDEEHSINNIVNYSDNAVIGSIKAPYMFFANTLGMEENAANTLSLYPNPTTTNAAISFETIYDIVEVFNSLGVKVAEYRNVDRIEGMEAAGVYVIRVTNDSTVQNCRLIVK